MKSKVLKSKSSSELHAEILKSMMASFKIEGIEIPLNVAKTLLKKIELSLGK